MAARLAVHGIRTCDAGETESDRKLRPDAVHTPLHPVGGHVLGWIGGVAFDQGNARCECAPESLRPSPSGLFRSVQASPIVHDDLET